jgi:hypothetical protein
MTTKDDEEVLHAPRNRTLSAQGGHPPKADSAGVFPPDTNGIILYDRLHARKELEAVLALIIGDSLKEGEVAIKQRGLLAMEQPFDQDKFLSAIESLFASSTGKPRW